MSDPYERAKAAPTIGGNPVGIPTEQELRDFVKPPPRNQSLVRDESIVGNSRGAYRSGEAKPMPHQPGTAANGKRY